MTTKTLFTIGAIVPVVVGAVALLAPEFLLGQVKMAEANDAASVMARTVGVLLLGVAFFNFAVRNVAEPATLRLALAANLFVHLALMPIDPLAYSHGTFHTFGSFVPNTILHIVFASAFAYKLWSHRPTLAATT